MTRETSGTTGVHQQRRGLGPRRQLGAAPRLGLSPRVRAVRRDADRLSAADCVATAKDATSTTPNARKWYLCNRWGKIKRSPTYDSCRAGRRYCRSPYPAAHRYRQGVTASHSSELCFVPTTALPLASAPRAGLAVEEDDKLIDNRASIPTPGDDRAFGLEAERWGSRAPVRRSRFPLVGS
jgi:hypothetical protein